MLAAWQLARRPEKHTVLPTISSTIIVQQALDFSLHQQFVLHHLSVQWFHMAGSWPQQFRRVLTYCWVCCAADRVGAVRTLQQLLLQDATATAAAAAAAQMLTLMSHPVSSSRSASLPTQQHQGPAQPHSGRSAWRLLPAQLSPAAGPRAAAVAAVVATVVGQGQLRCLGSSQWGVCPAAALGAWAHLHHHQQQQPRQGFSKAVLPVAPAGAPPQATCSSSSTPGARPHGLQWWHSRQL
jgi:hypothetical protein